MHGSIIVNLFLFRIAQDSLGEYILLEHFFMSENIAKVTPFLIKPFDFLVKVYLYKT